MKIESELGRYNPVGIKKLTLFESLKIWIRNALKGYWVWQREQTLLERIPKDDPRYDSARYSVAMITHPKSVTLTTPTK